MQRGVHLEVSDDFSTTSFNSPVLRFNRYRRDGAARANGSLNFLRSTSSVNVVVRVRVRSMSRGTTGIGSFVPADVAVTTDTSTVTLSDAGPTARCAARAASRIADSRVTTGIMWAQPTAARLSSTTL